MKLRVAIADDELLARDQLRRFLAEAADIEIVGECSDGKETLEVIHEKAPDLLFLDVKMPELDGLGVAESLEGRQSPAIIFVTAYDRFALRAFEISAVDYLLKPFDRARFQMALERARQRLQRSRDTRTHQLLAEVLAALELRQTVLQRFTVKSEGRIQLLGIDEIDWICAADNYVELHVGKACHLLRRSITSLEEQLPRDAFVRTSRSHLVNASRIKQILRRSHGDSLIILQNGTRLSASRKYRRNLAGLLRKAH